MKKLAIIAPNDRYNYGDLLFSYIVCHHLQEFYAEVCHFATQDADLTKVGGMKTTSIKKLKEFCDAADVDVILAGGHSLACSWQFTLSCLSEKYAWLNRVQYLFTKFMSSAKAERYANYFAKMYYHGSTLYPYSIGKNENVKVSHVLYNSVDGYLPDGFFYGANLKVFESVDYFSVRGLQTYNTLIQQGIKACLYPDCAIQMSKVFPLEELQNRAIPQILDYVVNNKYIVFQINRGLCSTYRTGIIENLHTLISRGYKICLCPIGYALGHDDASALKEIYDAINSDNLILFDDLSIWDIMYLIANSDAFIGSSLHGCITAMSFCRLYMGLDVAKTIEYIKTWGLGVVYCSSCEEFADDFFRMAECTTLKLESNFKKQYELSIESFNKMKGIIGK